MQLLILISQEPYVIKDTIKKMIGEDTALCLYQKIILVRQKGANMILCWNS